MKFINNIQYDTRLYVSYHNTNVRMTSMKSKSVRSYVIFAYFFVFLRREGAHKGCKKSII